MARIWKSFYDFPKFNNNIFFLQVFDKNKIFTLDLSIP